jgi:hypothetical protein
MGGASLVDDTVASQPGVTLAHNLPACFFALECPCLRSST